MSITRNPNDAAFYYLALVTFYTVLSNIGGFEQSLFLCLSRILVQWSCICVRFGVVYLPDLSLDLIKLIEYG
jgi:hypothetical protein